MDSLTSAARVATLRTDTLHDKVTWGPAMTSKEAEQTLSLIRTLMERSTCYTNLSGHAGIAAATATFVGCALRTWYNTPFLSTWIGVLLAAAGASLFFTAAMARANGEPAWSRQARTVVIAFT